MSPASLNIALYQTEKPLCDRLEHCFDALFDRSESSIRKAVKNAADMKFPRPTRLEGGFDEPIYLPDLEGTARIRYRLDYASSALHELAHWCIAGSSRLNQVDYGYWYEPDGRSQEQQKVFEQVEVKPQALEWLFSIAVGQAFNFSADNLDAKASVSAQFQSSVRQQAAVWLRQWDTEGHGLPQRASILLTALADCFDGQDRLRGALQGSLRDARFGDSR